MPDDFQHFDPVISNCKIFRENVRVKQYPADTVILVENETTDQVYFILEGRVKVTSFHANGKEVWHAVLEEGQTFGEMAALNNQAHSATITSSVKSGIGIISKAQFLKALESDSAVALFFLKDLAFRLQKTTLSSNERIALEMPNRICAELLRQASETPSKNGGFKVNSSLTVTGLAQQLNASREAVSRTMSSLIKAEYITKIGRQFYIIDKDEVQRRAEGVS